VLVGLDLVLGPDFLDPAVLACLLVGNTEAVLAGECKFLGVAFDVGRAAVDS
jgi:hypothetical protein